MKGKRGVDILKRPPVWLSVIIFVLTVIFIVSALVFTFVELEGVGWQVLSYVCYGLAAVSLAYSVYLIAVYASKIKKAYKRVINKFELTRELAQNYGARTVVFTIVSFLISVAYGAYNVTLSAIERSVWYGMLAAYYILLACMRGGVITHHRKKHSKEKRGIKVENEYVNQINRYRNCGIMLIVMTFALLIAVLQMVLIDRTFTHNGLMIYVSAAYTVYKVTMAIINIVRAKKQEDMTVQALRNINMADALVSILALQTSMLVAFSQENYELSPTTLNGVTGGVVCAMIFVLGIYMTVKACKKLKDIPSCQKVTGEIEGENAAAKETVDDDCELGSKDGENGKAEDMHGNINENIDSSNYNRGENTAKEEK